LQLGKFPYMPLLFVLPLMIASSQCAWNECTYMLFGVMFVCCDIFHTLTYSMNTCM
jgi:hypothetical protein